MLMRPMFHAVEQHCPAFWLQSQEVLIYSPRSAGGHCYHPHRRSIPQSLDIMGAHVHEMIMHDHSKYGIGLDSRLACTYSSRRQHALSLKLRASCPRTSAPSLRNMVKHCETCIYMVVAEFGDVGGLQSVLLLQSHAFVLFTSSLWHMGCPDT